MMKKYLISSIFMFTVLTAWAATKRALLVGISKYPTNNTHSYATWNAIHGANDVELIRKTLKIQGFKTTALLNANATAARIRRAMGKLLSESTVGDIIYLHFSCHGQPFEDLNNDEADGWDEAIVPYDAWKRPIKGLYMGQNHILDDELNVMIGNIRKKIGPTGFVYVVIDACHAGGANRGEEEDFIRGTQDGFSLTNKKYIPRIDVRSNIPVDAVTGYAEVCILEACRAYQTNFEIKQNGMYYGPLSYYVNQILQQQTLTIDTKWVSLVQRLMATKLTKQNMVIQTTKKQ